MKKLIALSTIVGTLLISGAPAMAATSDVTASIVGVSEAEGGLQITSAPSYSFTYDLETKEVTASGTDNLVIADLRAADDRDAFSVKVSAVDETAFNGAEFSLISDDMTVVLSDTGTSLNVNYAANDTLLEKVEAIDAKMDFTNLQTADDIATTLVWELDSGSSTVAE